MVEAKSWDEWNADGGPKYPHAKVIQFCFRNYPAASRPNLRVLDLGCGSGVNTKFLTEQGFDCWATDISSIGVKNTCNLLSAHGLKAVCATAKIEALPFRDAFFDLVISVGVFDSAGHVAAYKAISEIARILKPGGKALLVFASNEDMRIGNFTPYGLNGFSYSDVNDMIKGWSRTTIDRYITTYGNGASQHNDFLVILQK